MLEALGITIIIALVLCGIGYRVGINAMYFILMGMCLVSLLFGIVCTVLGIQ